MNADATAAPGPLVRTEQGMIRGAVRDGISVFRGVPFAAPPVGGLRFAPPAPASGWEGERDATEDGPASLQNVDPLSMVVPGAERDYYAPRTARFAEDCLYLNVVTPAADGASRPVLVWIHGGGFVTGSGSAEWYDGTRLARKNDVVVVTINYRLGILGGLYLSDLDPEASNVGLRDQVAALEWVRRNIAAFGGDPGRVTVFGQSAGGMAVSALLVSPFATGLFQRAIVQSGNVANFETPEDAARITDAVLAALKIERGPDLVERLRDVSTLRILEVQRTAGRFFPVADGITIPVDPLGAVGRGSGADVPLLIGNTSAENKLFHLLGFPVAGGDFDLRTGFEAFFGAGSDLAEQAAGLYRAGSPSEPDGELWDVATSDIGWIVPSRQLADAHARAGRPTWAFELAIRSTAFGGVVGAGHEVDVPFVFDVLGSAGVSELLGADVVDDPAAQALAERIGAAWAAFARDGVPVFESVAEWPDWRPDRRATLVLDRTSEVEMNRNAAKMDFWERHLSGVSLASLLFPGAE